MSTELHIDRKKTVGELVAAAPGLSKVFERLGIDYCCGGNRLLEEVCREKGLDAKTVAAVLDAAGGAEAAGQTPDADAMDTPALVAHIIENHHRYLRDELPRLVSLTEKVADGHGGRNPALYRVATIVQDLSRALLAHLETEEERLFPVVLSHTSMPGAGDETLRSLVEELEGDHRETGAALEELRSLTDGYAVPEWGCNTYRALMDALAELERDIHQHVHKENNMLFRRIVSS